MHTILTVNYTSVKFGTGMGKTYNIFEAEPLRNIMWWHQHCRLILYIFCFFFHSHTYAFIARDQIKVLSEQGHTSRKLTLHTRLDGTTFPGESSEARAKASSLNTEMQVSDSADPGVRL